MSQERNDPEVIDDGNGNKRWALSADVSGPDFLDECVARFRAEPDKPHYCVDLNPPMNRMFDTPTTWPNATVLYLPAGWTIQRFLREQAPGKWKLRRRAS